MSEKTQTTIEHAPFTLIEEAQQARANLLTVGTRLVEAAINDGEPSRDISSHPDYIAAQERLCTAVSALGRIVIGDRR